MIKTTVGQLLINEALPEDMRDYGRVLDKKGVKELYRELAAKHPEKYREVSKKLNDVARRAASETGGFSVGLSDLVPPPEVEKLRVELRQKVRKIVNSPGTQEQKEAKLVKLLGDYQEKFVKTTMESAKKHGNKFAQQVISGSRGNPSNLNALLGAPLLYMDYKNDLVPVPVLNNYSRGLRMDEYLAGAFGARRGVIDVKLSTQDAGFLAKQMVQASHRLVVDEDDDEDVPGSEFRGLVVDTDDPDNVGAYLAHPVGGYKRNTLITPKIQKELRSKGVKQILVRSPLVGGPRSGGVYARDVGWREKMGLPPKGDMVGIAAAQALAEPVTQMQISSKHTGGMAASENNAALTGFKYINQLIQVPKQYVGGAVHAEEDGLVTRIEKAPQGGHFIYIGSTKHYVPVDRKITVKPRMRVEAGDVLTEGIPNPAKVVQHKGIGEGRRYFVQMFREALKNSGTPGHRRNIELLTRGLINHVRLTQELGDWGPEDIVPYQLLEKNWKPRASAKEMPLNRARGMYLEQPLLHYSVGTKLRPSVVENLKKFGINKVVASPEDPPFVPEMVRGIANVTHDPDWMTRFLGGYQQRSLLDATHRGAVSDSSGSSFVPALAEGKQFGHIGATKTWKPEDILKQP